MMHAHELAVVAIDLQEKLLPTIDAAPKVLERASRMLRFARQLNLPVLWTEQYPKGLGATARPVADALEGLTPIEKTVFGCMGHAPFHDALQALGKRQILLTGIEGHICVMQTALGALDAGYEVFVARDAIGSSAPEELQAGLERMEKAGATIVTTQMAMFELLREAGTPEFKRVLPLLKADTP
jgi:nicotinamidase-related amidase